MPAASECSLWLVDISEPRNNNLRLIVIEARPEADLQETLLGPARPVHPDERSRAWEIIWFRYVGYSVRNESYLRAEDGVITLSGGERLLRLSNSAYLRYIAATTFATNEYPGELTHWALYTDWHCIDVVSDSAPQIRELSRTETAEYLAKAIWTSDAPRPHPT